MPSATPTEDRPYRRVAILGLAGGGLDAQIMKGFNLFRRGREPWTLLDAGHQGEWIERVLGRVSMVDGVLANVATKDMADRLAAAGVPVVDPQGFVPGMPFARVGADPASAARAAAAYFLERRFRRMVYVSASRWPFERWRWEGFRDALTTPAGGADLAAPPGWFTLEVGRWVDVDGAERPMSQAEFTAMLREADEPVAVFCAYDRPGMQLCDLCRAAGIPVPERVAILGCDDNAYLCESSEPPLSSIILPGEKIGYEAGRVLDAMMNGEPPPPEPLLLPPVGVHTRQSTDITAIEDRPIADALAILRRRAAEPVNVSELGDAVHLDRRTFYRRFRKAVGRTPLQELYRLRVELARERLVSTNASVYAIAIDAGFPDADIFAQRFREHVGMTPSAFRARHAI